MPRRKNRKKAEPTVAGILGVGLDGNDGHTRLTRTEEMVIMGGSSETHERMQETAIRFAEELDKRGQRLEDTPAREAVDLLRVAIERVG